MPSLTLPMYPNSSNRGPSGARFSRGWVEFGVGLIPHFPTCHPEQALVLFRRGQGRVEGPMHFFKRQGARKSVRPSDPRPSSYIRGNFLPVSSVYISGKVLGSPDYSLVSATRPSRTSASCLFLDLKYPAPRPWPAAQGCPGENQLAHRPIFKKAGIGTLTGKL